MRVATGRASSIDLSETVDLVTGESHGSFLWLMTAEGIDTLTSAPDAT